VIEQTLSIVKPDAVERNLENRIKSFFKEKNLKILKNKKVQKFIFYHRMKSYDHYFTGRNETILLQVGEDLIRFALHLPPQMPPQTKNGLRSKP